MANLIKRGARSPRVSGGYAYVGCDYNMAGPKEIDGFPPILYGLTVGNRHITGEKPKNEEHKVELSEAEMLDTITEWMKLFTRNQAERRKARAKS